MTVGRGKCLFGLGLYQILAYYKMAKKVFEYFKVIGTSLSNLMLHENVSIKCKR